MSDYDPRNWYWFVAGDQTQVYSSASGTFVPVADATYQTWRQSNGNLPARIESAASLGGALAGARQRPVDASVLAAYQSALVGIMDAAQFRVLFNHENRIRALESKAPISQQQFTAAVAALL